jgi:hypothetical protein
MQISVNIDFGVQIIATSILLSFFQYSFCFCYKMTSPKKTRSTTREKLKHDGYMYTVDRKGANGQIYWKCVDRKCRGRLIEYEDQSMKVKEHQCLTTEFE